MTDETVRVYTVTLIVPDEADEADGITPHEAVRRFRASVEEGVYAYTVQCDETGRTWIVDHARREPTRRVRHTLPDIDYGSIPLDLERKLKDARRAYIEAGHHPSGNYATPEERTEALQAGIRQAQFAAYAAWAETR